MKKNQGSRIIPQGHETRPCFRKPRPLGHIMIPLGHKTKIWGRTLRPLGHVPKNRGK